MGKESLMALIISNLSQEKITELMNLCGDVKIALEDFKPSTELAETLAVKGDFEAALVVLTLATNTAMATPE